MQVAAGLKPAEDARRIIAAVVTTAGDRLLRRYAINHLYDLDPDLARRLASEGGLTLDVEPRDEAAPTDEQIIDALVRHGVVEAAEAARRVPTVPDDLKDLVESPAARVLATLNRFASFEAIVETVPYRYDRLILDLSRRTAGRFTPEAVLEVFEPLPGEDERRGTYLVQFIHGGRLYRFRPPDEGPWYDVEAVRAALNRALADAGLADRFVLLDSASPIVELVFAPPDALAAAAGEIGIGLRR